MTCYLAWIKNQQALSANCSSAGKLWDSPTSFGFQNHEAMCGGGGPIVFTNEKFFRYLAQIFHKNVAKLTFLQISWSNEKQVYWSIFDSQTVFEATFDFFGSFVLVKEILLLERAMLVPSASKVPKKNVIFLKLSRNDFLLLLSWLEPINTHRSVFFNTYRHHEHRKYH